MSEAMVNPYSGQFIPPDALQEEFDRRGATQLFDAIIRADHQKNHSDREYDADYVLKAFGLYVQMGGQYFQQGNVVIVLRESDGVLEFHCLNGGDGRDLTGAINAMLDKYRTSFHRAVTYYDNPRINELIRYSKFPAYWERVDMGVDATYRMSFDMRSS